MKFSVVAKKLLFSTKIYNYYLSNTNIHEISFTPKDAWPGDPAIGDDIVQGIYNLANIKIYSPEVTLWHIKKKNKIWFKEAHSFSWLRHLKARSGYLARKQARYLILEWLRLNKNWKYETWELEILSRRVSAWVTNFDFLMAEKDEVFSKILILNLFKQIKYLREQTSRRHFVGLEREFGFEISSIKKIKILRGLFLTSMCFDNDNKTFTKFIKILEKELQRSFNIEGTHLSKSPSSQLTIIGDLVTIREAMISIQEKVPDFLELTIKKAAHSLRFFRKPNGKFATFNGSKQETKFLIDKILNQADGKARGRGPLNLVKSGFDKIGCQGTNVFVDIYNDNKSAASMAPHAIEINVGKSRLLGSCGTIYEKNKEWKNSLLSASAHSALVIEDTNPENFKNSQTSNAYRRYQRNGSEIIHLIHTGYKNKFSATCSRVIEVSKNGKNIAILDQISSEKNLNFTIRMHLHPKIKASLSLDKKKAIIIFNDQGWNFSFHGKAELSLEPSIFVTDDGKIRESNQLILSGKTCKIKTEVLWGFVRNL